MWRQSYAILQVSGTHAIVYILSTRVPEYAYPDTSSWVLSTEYQCALYAYSMDPMYPQCHSCEGLVSLTAVKQVV